MGSPDRNWRQEPPGRNWSRGHGEGLHHRLAYRPIWSRCSLSCDPFFPDDPSLCQVHTHTPAYRVDRGCSNPGFRSQGQDGRGILFLWTLSLPDDGRIHIVAKLTCCHSNGTGLSPVRERKVWSASLGISNLNAYGFSLFFVHWFILKEKSFISKDQHFLGAKIHNLINFKK